jgi:hypothetical protein
MHYGGSLLGRTKVRVALRDGLLVSLVLATQSPRLPTDQGACRRVATPVGLPQPAGALPQPVHLVRRRPGEVIATS